MKRLKAALLEIVTRKVHGAPFIGQDDIYDEIPQRPAVVKRHILPEILCVDRIDKDTDIVHRTGFFLQGLLHDIEQHGKDHVQLFR